MCGILVVFSKSGALDAPLCRRALSSMNWRGPDFTYSRVWNNCLFLGQTVLSLTGHPEEAVGRYHISKSKRYELYFNGEIYNYKELNKRFLDDISEFGTDTEVLTNLHDKMLADKIPLELDGMYAYITFDQEKKALYLSRDPQGEKSLYIYEDGECVVIASSISAIRMVKPKIPIDVQALRDYFLTRHLMLFGRTVFSGIREVMPGAFETFDLKTVKWGMPRRNLLKGWIDAKRYEESYSRAFSSLTDELDSLLDVNVKEMLPQDRVYSSIVSGGVDSSLISHYVVKNGNPNILVAVNHIGKDRISNDLKLFEKYLKRGIDVIDVDLPTYAGEIERCQKGCGSPLPAHSFVPQSIQCSYVRSSQSRVLFGGDGADELFGGYPAYLGEYSVRLPYSPSPYTKLQEPLVKFFENKQDVIKSHLASAWKEAVEAYSFVENDADRSALAMMYCDTVYQLPYVGLRGSDLMAMMWSVEMRSVFLRKNIIKFALNLPVWAKIDRRCEPSFGSKIILKELFKRHYNESLLVEKQGFSGFPNESGTYLGDLLDFEAIQVLKIDPQSVPNAIKDRATAWKLINIEYFLRNVK